VRSNNSIRCADLRHLLLKVFPMFTILENHPKLPEAISKSLTAFVEIVFWMLVFSLLTGLTRVLRKHQGFGFSVGRAW
jgi:hypothetical protein